MKITLEGVSFTYNGRSVLRSVNLEVESGKVYLLVGKNGSGKTTLLKILAGLLVPKGKVYVDGKVADHFLLRQLVGYVFQNPASQIIGATVEEDIIFSLEMLGIEREEMEKRLRTALKVVGLEGMEKEDPLNLSGGQKQRLAIASVLVRDPPFLALDEPVSMLDLPSQIEIFKLLLELKEKGKGIVIATHELEYLEGVDEVVHLKDGMIDVRGSTTDFVMTGFPDVEIPFSLRILEKCRSCSKRRLEDAHTLDKR